MADFGYTVVQHSGFGYNDDPQFEKGLEPRKIPNKKSHDAIVKAGGLVLPGYGEADDFCDTAAYPKGTEGLIPNAQGTFADLQVDGLKVYVPVRQVVG